MSRKKPTKKSAQVLPEPRSVFARVAGGGGKLGGGLLALFGAYALYFQVADPRVSIASVGTRSVDFLYINLELLNESYLVPLKQMRVVADFGARGGNTFEHAEAASQLSNVRELRPRDVVFVGLRWAIPTPPKDYTEGTACVVVTYTTILGDRRREFGFYRQGGDTPSPWLRRSCGDDPLRQDPTPRF